MVLIHPSLVAATVSRCCSSKRTSSPPCTRCSFLVGGVGGWVKGVGVDAVHHVLVPCLALEPRVSWRVGGRRLGATQLFYEGHVSSALDSRGGVREGRERTGAGSRLSSFTFETSGSLLSPLIPHVLRARRLGQLQVHHTTSVGTSGVVGGRRKGRGVAGSRGAGPSSSTGRVRSPSFPAPPRLPRPSLPPPQPCVVRTLTLKCEGKRTESERPADHHVGLLLSE
jgi:hypothetical protein